MGKFADLKEFASAVNFFIIKKESPFDALAAIGLFEGFIVEVSYSLLQNNPGIIQQNNGSKILQGPASFFSWGDRVATFIIRFKQNSIKDPLLFQRITNSQELLFLMNEKKFARQEYDSIIIGTDVVLFNWHYHYNRPEPTEIKNVLEELVKIIKSCGGGAIGTTCEKCMQSDAKIYSINRIPYALCMKCKEKIQYEEENINKEYRKISPGYVKVISIGLITAIICSFGFTLISFLVKSLSLSALLIIAIVMPVIMKAYLKRETSLGYIIILIISSLAIMLGNYIYFLFASLKSINKSIGMELVINISKEFFSFLIHSKNLLYILISIALINSYLYGTRKIKFKITSIDNN